MLGLACADVWIVFSTIERSGHSTMLSSISHKALSVGFVGRGFQFLSVSSSVIFLRTIANRSSYVLARI